MTLILIMAGILLGYILGFREGFKKRPSFPVQWHYGDQSNWPKGTGAELPYEPVPYLPRDSAVENYYPAAPPPQPKPE